MPALEGQCQLIQSLVTITKILGLAILAWAVYGLLRTVWFWFLAFGSREVILLARKNLLYALGGIVLAAILYSAGSIVSWSDVGADLIARCSLKV